MCKEIKESRFDLQALIEYWSHDRFGGGNFKQHLDSLLRKWDLKHEHALQISDLIFNVWLPAYVHYFPVSEPTILSKFIEALAAKLVWTTDEFMEDFEPTGYLWRTCISRSNLEKGKRIAVYKYSADIDTILAAIQKGQSKLPEEISAWLFNKLRGELKATQKTIAVAAAKSETDFPEDAEVCLSVTDSVRTSVENLLIKATEK